ncbi:MAG: antigen [Pedosphaera sp.]|nr:antigen [Pedosphaera sp.]
MKTICTFISSAALLLSTNLSTMTLIAQDQSTNTSSQTSTNLSATGQPSGSVSQQQVNKWSSLKGETVENKTGEKVGTVNDLVVDTQTGQLDYAIIASGGVAGIGSKMKIVPPMALSTATAKKGVLSLDVGPEQWKDAPSFTKDQISNLNNPTQAQQIYQYYHQTWPAMASGTPGGTQPLSPTGRNPAAQAGQLSLASDLVGKRVVNSQNQDVGKISDLLVQLNNPKTTFAILKPGSFITDANKEAGKELFAIPVNAFKTSPDSNKVVLDVDPSQFQQAQPITESSWSAATSAGGSPQIFRFDPNAGTTGIAPDNTKMNERDRQPGAVTPTDQSENRDDLRMTQLIRQSIVRDDTLSTMAKNVKIVTANGKVTLRGPVHTEQEKSEVERLAQQAAGTANVQSEIEVKGN